MNNDGTTLAPEGHLWVCLACGKTSKTRFGFDESNARVAMRGWDASCVMNSELIAIDRITSQDAEGRVYKISGLEDDPPESPEAGDPDTTAPSLSPDGDCL